jgi:hypothetical protein
MTTSPRDFLGSAAACKPDFWLPITRAANDQYPLRVEIAPSGMMIVQPFSPDIIDLALSSAS